MDHGAGAARALIPGDEQEESRMTADGAVVVVGGTRAIGLEIVRRYAERGFPVVGDIDGDGDVAHQSSSARRGSNFRKTAMPTSRIPTDHTVTYSTCHQSGNCRL